MTTEETNDVYIHEYMSLMGKMLPVCYRHTHI